MDGEVQCYQPQLLPVTAQSHKAIAVSAPVLVLQFRKLSSVVTWKTSEFTFITNSPFPVNLEEFKCLFFQVSFFFKFPFFLYFSRCSSVNSEGFIKLLWLQKGRNPNERAELLEYKPLPPRECCQGGDGQELGQALLSTHLGAATDTPEVEHAKSREKIGLMLAVECRNLGL